ncbi:MAG: tetratricopeptide repeat protein, partial [Candidatus Edwardsbacteria bacterium]|nr:tetratricopeptide repeat protein [Candidatus Edwardsbacteria bacterium]
YKNAIELDPEYAMVYFNLGIAYSELEDYSQAIFAYKKAIESDPNYAMAYYNLGVVYSKLRDYPQAIQAYKKAIESDPNYAKAYFNLGIAYSELEDYSQAIFAYKKAIEIDSNYAKAYFNLGVNYGRLKKYKEAKESFIKAGQLDSNLADKVRRLLELIELEMEKQGKLGEEFKPDSQLAFEERQSIGQRAKSIGQRVESMGTKAQKGKEQRVEVKGTEAQRDRGVESRGEELESITAQSKRHTGTKAQSEKEEVMSREGEGKSAACSKEELEKEEVTEGDIWQALKRLDTSLDWLKKYRDYVGTYYTEKALEGELAASHARRNWQWAKNILELNKIKEGIKQDFLETLLERGLVKQELSSQRIFTALIDWLQIEDKRQEKELNKAKASVESQKDNLAIAKRDGLAKERIKEIELEIKNQEENKQRAELEYIKVREFAAKLDYLGENWKDAPLSLRNALAAELIYLGLGDTAEAEYLLRLKQEDLIRGEKFSKRTKEQLGQALGRYEVLKKAVEGERRKLFTELERLKIDVETSQTIERGESASKEKEKPGHLESKAKEKADGGSLAFALAKAVEEELDRTLRTNNKKVTQAQIENIKEEKKKLSKQKVEVEDIEVQRHRGIDGRGQKEKSREQEENQNLHLRGVSGAIISEGKDKRQETVEESIPTADEVVKLLWESEIGVGIEEMVTDGFEERVIDIFTEEIGGLGYDNAKEIAEGLGKIIDKSLLVKLKQYLEQAKEMFSQGRLSKDEFSLE